MAVENVNRGRLGIDLAIAGGWMVLTGVGLLILALAAPAGTAPSLDSTTIPLLAVGLVLVASGVEIFRRRHFLLAFLPAVAMAVGDLAYCVYIGRVGDSVTGLVMYGFAALVVSTRRAEFI